jgi:hypothetical protein
VDGLGQNGRVRFLQVAGLRIIYAQGMTYRTEDPGTDTAEAVVLAPFSAQLDRNRYAETLKESNEEFASIVRIDEVMVDENAGAIENPNPTSSPTIGNSGSINNQNFICASVLAIVASLRIF